MKTEDSLFEQLPNYVKDIETEILEGQIDPRRRYHRTEEKFVRRYKFRHHLMQIYNYTCCMSSLKTVPDFGLIEAAHIRDHALTGDSTIPNGIPLCKNLHYAFDNGIISLNDNYQILVQNKKEYQETTSLYNIRPLAGKTILLPENTRYYPAIENLKWHRNKFGF